MNRGIKINRFYEYLRKSTLNENDNMFPLYNLIFSYTINNFIMTVSKILNFPKLFIPVVLKIKHLWLGDYKSVIFSDSVHVYRVRKGGILNCEGLILLKQWDAFANINLVTF